mgnify:FL=1
MIKKTYFLPSEYNLFSYEEVRSTMITARELANKSGEIGTIVWAKNQTEGRGRQGKSWVSPPGNLYFSFIRESEQLSKNLLFSPVYITSLSLAETIEEISSSSIDLFIKWPNDLLVNGSKIAGILIERFLSFNKKDLLNIGVGVNVNNSPNNVGYITTNLKKENVNISPKDLLLCFFENLSRNEKKYNTQGLELILKKWKKYSHNKGDKLKVKLGNNNLEGIFEDIDKNGALILLLKNGKTETIYAGDVFVL